MSKRLGRIIGCTNNISITPCLMGYYIASVFFFLCTYMTIKVTILSAQPLIPPKRLYAQKVQACFDMYQDHVYIYTT